jgi:hypothetical protein
MRIKLIFQVSLLTRAVYEYIPLDVCMQFFKGYYLKAEL